MFTARVSQMDYRNQLKQVQKKDYRLDGDDDKTRSSDKPKWAQPKQKAPASDAVSESED